MPRESEQRRYVAAPADLKRGTLVQLFLEGVKHDRPDALRRETPQGWEPVSHAEVKRRVLHAGLALEALGIQRGDRLAILSENRLEWALADFASLCAGGLDVPVYATLPAAQVGYVLRDSGARVVFVSDAAQLEKVTEVRGDLPELEHVIVFDDAAAGEGTRSWTSLLELGAGRAAEADEAEFWSRAEQAQPDDVATLIYTSGTTGEPKGVMLTHDNIFSNTEACAAVIRADARDVSVSFLPLSHIFERMVDYWLFRFGCSIAYVAAIENVAKALATVQPTFVASTPRVYEKLYAKVLSVTGVKRPLVFWARKQSIDYADAKLAGKVGAGLKVRHAIADKLVLSKLRAAVGGKLRFFISGGGPLNATINRFFYGAGLAVYEGYGLTETSPVTNVNTPTDFKFGTVGKPIPGTEIMLADDGEILVRGPQVMKGYYNRPEATAEVIDSEGWFRTGDIGEIDAEGFLRITDRKKDLIVTAGGKNIAPQPIENRVKSNRYVAEAVMFGDRRPYPVMLIVPNLINLGAWAQHKGFELPEGDELAADVRVRDKIQREVGTSLEGLARFEMPKKIAVLPREFSIERGELTPKLSVRRREVEKNYAHVLHELYGPDDLPEV